MSYKQLVNVATTCWWNSYSKHYDSMWDTPLNNTVFDTLIEDIRSQDVRSVLELGCGTGLLTSRLADAGLSVAAVEQNLEALRRARSRCSGISFIQGDVSELDTLVTTSSDAIIAANLLQVCANLSEVMRSLSLYCLRTEPSLVVFLWPADELTNEYLFRSDRKAGHAFLPLLGADILRRAYGLSGSILGIRKNKTSDIRAQIEAFGRAVNGFVKENPIGQSHHCVSIFLPTHAP